MKIVGGQWALVTGAGSGIGLATTVALAKLGVNVLVVDLTKEKCAVAIARVRERCADAARCIAIPFDVSKADEVEAAKTVVHAETPGLDILVNNAGVSHLGGIADTPLDQWEWVMGVNVWGPIHVSRTFVPAMMARKSGHVVNVASIFGFYGPKGLAPYATSKFAVMGLSESMRGELAAHGIGVSAVCPGMTKTAITESTRFASGDDGARRETLRRMLDKRAFQPEQVADAIIGAIAHNRAVVPVSREANILYYAKRYLAELEGPLTRAARWHKLWNQR